MYAQNPSIFTILLYHSKSGSLSPSEEIGIAVMRLCSHHSKPVLITVDLTKIAIAYYSTTLHNFPCCFLEKYFVQTFLNAI